MTSFSHCAFCARLLTGMTCEAFAQIPREIFTGEQPHDRPVDGDGGKTFVLRDDLTSGEKTLLAGLSFPKSSKALKGNDCHDDQGKFCSSGGNGHDNPAESPPLADAHKSLGEKVLAALKAVAGGLLHKGADSGRQLYRTATDLSRSYREGGVTGASKEAVGKVAKSASDKYQMVARRYGHKAAIAMSAAYLGVYAAYAFNPKLMAVFPSPSLQLIGAAEGIRAGYKAARKLLGKATAAALLTDPEYLHEVRAFFNAVASAAGVRGPDVADNEILLALKDALGA